MNINSNNPFFYPYSIEVKRQRMWNNVNEIRHIEWHEACKCKCRLDASICNNKHRWKEDKCGCQCRRRM